MSRIGAAEATQVRRRGIHGLIQRSPDGMPLTVPGTLVVAFLVASGRWGSYLGFPRENLYLTDVLLVVSFAWTFLRYRHLLGSAARHSWRQLSPILALVVWGVLRFATGPVSADAIRDVAPYAYLTVGTLAAVAVTPTAVRRSARVLFVALVFHLLWVTLSAVLGDPFVGKAPVLGGVIRVFELRPDFDGAMLAILAGTALYAALCPDSARAPGRTALLAALGLWASGAVLLLANRAAVLALLTAYLVTVVRLLPQLRHLWQRWRGWVVAVGAVMLVLLAVIIPQTPTYQRLSGSGSFVQGTTAGTTAAHQAAWGLVLRYTNQTPERVAVGVGTGPDFLKASGAWVHYQAVGHSIVRQPHNFALNTYARLGLVGVLLLAWLLGALSFKSLQLLRSSGRSAAELGWVLAWATLFVTSLVGVILEAPFGAIPFAWAAGRVLLWRPQSAPLLADRTEPGVVSDVREPREGGPGTRRKCS